MPFKNLISLVFFFAWTIFSFGQTPVQSLPIEKDSLNKDYYLVTQRNDSLIIALDNVWLRPRLRLSKENDRQQYILTRRRVLKVWPYAKLGRERMQTVDETLENVKKRSHKKQYIRRAQKYMYNELADTLKSFSRSEGRILFKLIYRQTGETAFDIVKEYRSGWNAFWYNTAASVYDLTMKQEYDPLLDKEDFFIEEILRNAFASDLLEEQEAAIPLDLEAIYTKWVQELRTVKEE